MHTVSRPNWPSKKKTPQQMIIALLCSTESSGRLLPRNGHDKSPPKCTSQHQTRSHECYHKTDARQRTIHVTNVRIYTVTYPMQVLDAGATAPVVKKKPTTRHEHPRCRRKQDICHTRGMLTPFKHVGRTSKLHEPHASTSPLQVSPSLQLLKETTQTVQQTTRPKQASDYKGACWTHLCCLGASRAFISFRAWCS